jgi:ABC-type branched-subunit amino acid transport system substrate-binding protein
MSRIRPILVPLLVAGLSFGVAACGDDSSDDSSSSGGGGEATLDLTIGDLIPLTGDLSDFGPPGDKAANLAVDKINEAAQEAGADHTVTLVTEDDQTSDQAGVSAARKLVSDGASCIAGSWASSVTIPVARSVSLREGVLEISPASTSDEITGLDDPDGLINRTAPPDSFQGPTLADAIAEDLGGADGKTVNIGARNDSYGTGLAKTFSDAWEAQGGSIGQEVIYDPEAATYDSEASKITSGSPDATVIIDFPETFAKVGPALVRTGNYDPSTTWGTDGLASSSLPKDVGTDATNGFRGTAPGTPDKDATTKAFDEAYVAADPKDVDRQTFDAQNFDAVVLCYLAAVAAGSTDGTDMAATVRDISAPPGDPFTWEELPDAIKALQNGDDIDYQGASGAIDMDENGDATAGVYDIYEYKGDAIDLVGEVPVNTGEGEGQQ